MAERSSSLACKKFSANVFDKNKCQNCFKPKDVHQDASPTQPQRPTTLEVGVNRSKTTVKSGSLCIATQVSTLPNIQVQKWEKVWFMLYSSGDLEWFSSEATKASLGSISLDDCTGLTSAEVDTMEPFSIGIKTSAKTHYLKAENRLEMDNWCRVLKPFVIASPGYRFNKKSPTTRTLSYHDAKISSPNIVQERKNSLSRTVSAPWHAISDQNNASGSNLSNVTKKRWSATEELLVKKEATDKNTKRTPGETEATNSSKKQVKTELTTELTTDRSLEPYYSDIYLTPEPSEHVKQNGETSTSSTSSTAIETELAEARRLAKLNQGKAEMYSNNLSDSKKQLEKANNVISIQKVNLETLTTEVETLKTRLKRSDEVVEKRLKEIDSRYPTCNGSASQDSIESSFIKLQSKLQENEKALIRRTRELENANESRKKVAKHTRALLVELEEKLTANNSRINELEEQLMNKTLDLQYEKDERQRIEREKGQLTKGLTISSLHSKQREINKRSTELLQQAKEDHKNSKNEQKLQQEIEGLHKKLEAKNFEIQRLREQVVLDKKNGEIRKLEAAYKKANEQVDALKTELGLVNECFSREKMKYSELESRVQDISMKVKEKEKQTNEMQKQNAELKSEIERTRKECDTQVLLLQEDNETTRTRLHQVQEEIDALHTETDGHNPNEFEELSRDFQELKSNSLKRESECKKLRDSQIETVRDFNNEKNQRLKLEKDFEEKNKELKNSEKELEKIQELLRTAERKFENESKRVSELEEIVESTKVAGEKLEAKNTQDLNKLRAQIQNYQTEIKEIRGKHDQSNEEVLDLNKKLENRSMLEEEVLSRIENVDSSLRESNPDLFGSDKKISSHIDESNRERTRILNSVECLSRRIEILKGSFKEEKERAGNLERSLQAKDSSARRCSVCEKRKNETSNLVHELEEVKETHRKELERLQNSIKSESLTSKSHAEEMKLKLTSKVILLQSDISELNAKHERELNQVNEQRKQEIESLLNKHEEEQTQVNVQHKQDADSWREKHESELILANERHKQDSEAWREKHESELILANERHKQDIEAWREKHESELILANERHKQDIDSWREKHESELKLANEKHKQDIDSLRGKCESLDGSNKNEIGSLREKIGQLEAQLLSERESNEQRIETLKKDYEAKATAREVHANGDVGLDELQEQHGKELEEIKENHRKELEENKSDMMMVLQALKSDSYQSSSMSSESLEMNDELKKLERYVETLKKEHGQEMERLNQEHEQDLEQLRSDMVTLLRVQETYKTPDEGKADPNGNIVDLEGQLAVLKRSHEKEMLAKEAQHKNETDQLKSDMLVAIQAASAVANIRSKTSNTSSPDERVAKLEQYIANQEREFEEERENLQNTIKKAESATKFGLRRNEEMSNKIYQMQREMEEIDTKYQKEIKLYKEAFDQEKNRKTTIGAVPGILAENESLKVKLQELELTMEQTQVRYDSEIKRYKEKFQQENVLTVEELQFKIKSLEDGIEQMRLEHETEVEKYTKAVRRGKVSLTSTVKERDLERKIDDLESKFDVMRQKHREEVRKYRERLEDEMERHRKESRANQRKSETDTRQIEDLKNKITELENKTSKLTKEASKCKEQEVELAETKGKNRELQRQVDALKRKLDKLEEAAEENKESGNESIVTSSKAKLSRYSSCDNIGSRTKSPPAGETSESANNEDDVFELNNNSGKSEIGGYKLNQGIKRPASVSAFPVQNETRRTTYTEKKRDSGSTSTRSSYQPSYLKNSTSTSSLK